MPRAEGVAALEGPRLLTVAAVSAEFGVSIDWVYANARALGAIRLGSGPRARLRFDRATIMDRIAKVATNLLTHHLLPAFAALRLSQLDYAVIDRYVEVKQLEARKSARRRGAA